MNQLRRQIIRPLAACLVGAAAVFSGCATEDAVERVDPITGEKSYSTTLWSSEKKATPVTHDDIKKAAEQPK